MRAPESVPTIAVVHPEGDARGFIVINASDFNPAVHAKWPDEPPADEKSSTAPSKRGSKS